MLLSVAASLQPAGFLRRLAAASYDLLLVAALLLVVTRLVIQLRGGIAVEPGSGWFQVLLLLVWWAYFAVFWVRAGQTVGMRAWRLVVTRQDGGPVGLAAASVRFVTAALSAALLGLGFLASLVDPEKRSWHDRLSGTRLRVRPKSTQAHDRHDGQRE